MGPKKMTRDLMLVFVRLVNWVAILLGVTYVPQGIAILTSGVAASSSAPLVCLSRMRMEVSGRELGDARWLDKAEKWQGLWWGQFNVEPPLPWSASSPAGDCQKNYKFLVVFQLGVLLPTSNTNEFSNFEARPALARRDVQLY